MEDNKLKCPARHFRKCRDNCAWWDWEIRDCAVTVISDGILDICKLLEEEELPPVGGTDCGDD